jgi:hypothetical protein
MKVSTIALAFCFCFFSYGIVQAQAPDAFCYQGVAASATGVELVNQNITLRMSILKGSASGTPVYIETHQSATDKFGLFSVDIGTGLPQIGSFAAIEWQFDKHFLKVEMDPTGGTVFQLMGVSQLLSVPYALMAGKAQVSTQAQNAGMADTAQLALQSNASAYADSASVTGQATFATNAGQATFATNADSASFALNAQQAVKSDTALVALFEIGDFDRDSTNELQELTYDSVTGMLSLTKSNVEVPLFDLPFSAPGADIDFPLGLAGQARIFGSGDQAVPSNKVFFMTSGKEDFQIKLGTQYFNHKRFPSFPVFSGGTIIKDCLCSGILMDPNVAVEPVLINFGVYPQGYTVPNGKNFVLKSGASILFVTNPDLGLNSTIFYPYENDAYSGSMIFPANTTLNPFGMLPVILTGYLINQPN